MQKRTNVALSLLLFISFSFCAQKFEVLVYSHNLCNSVELGLCTTCTSIVGDVYFMVDCDTSTNECYYNTYSYEGCNGTYITRNEIEKGSCTTLYENCQFVYYLDNGWVFFTIGLFVLIVVGICILLALAFYLWKNKFGPPKVKPQQSERTSLQ